MADEEDTYERFFRAREPDVSAVGGKDGDGDDGTPPPFSVPPPSSEPPPPSVPLPPSVPSPPSTPNRRDRPMGAQERLMARIAASRRARQRRAFLVAGGLVSALVLFVAGAGWALTGYVNHLVGRVNAGTSAAPPGAPVNILLAGVDRRAGLTRHQQLALHVGNVPSSNSDTMMLVHISPAHSRVTVVSLPRDTWVNIPGHGMNKINAAYGLGGPKLMVQTVEQATGLTINNYVEVGFLAFVKIVDAIGGVNVCLPVALNDPSSGINMRPGLHHVDGITALKYARDRHSFPLQDLTRIQDQQSLMFDGADQTAQLRYARQPAPAEPAAQDRAAGTAGGQGTEHRRARGPDARDHLAGRCVRHRPAGERQLRHAQRPERRAVGPVPGGPPVQRNRQRSARDQDRSASAPVPLARAPPQVGGCTSSPGRLGAAGRKDRRPGGVQDSAPLAAPPGQPAPG